MGAGASTNGVEAVAKTNGDAAFRNKDYLLAIIFYTEAIESATHSSEVFNPFESAVVFSNRSAAFYLCEQYQNALADGLSAVELQPRWPKGHYRTSRALQKCDRFIEALDSLQKAHALAPEDKTIAGEMEQLLSHISKNVIPLGVGCTFSWGLASTGGLGHPEARDKTSPTSIAALARKHVVDVSCGAMHTVAVTGTGEVFAWGDNKHGQVGLELLSSERAQGVTAVPVPRLLPSLIGIHVDAVSCGAGHTVVCARDGRVFSWGVGQQGQLGHNNLQLVAEPTQIMSLVHEKYCIAAVTCGIAHTFFLTDLGQLLACGQNLYGALGMDTSAEAVLLPTLTEVNFQEDAKIGEGEGASRIVHISCGGAHTAVVDSRGRLYCTGSNTCGQLGLGDFNDFYCSFSQVTNFLGEASTKVNVIRDLQTREEIYGRHDLPVCAYVSCGEEFTAVITRDHDVYTAGLGLGGQLGLADNPEKLHTFRLVSTLTGKGIEEISCSQGTVFAAAENGDVYNWGVTGDQAFSRDYTEADIKIIPIKNNAFKNRKRARQISCGRKHYVLLTIAPFGPSCEPIKGLASAADNGADESITVVAGKLVKFDIQSKDVRGQNVDFGGSVFQGLITRVSQDNDDCEKWGDNTAASNSTPVSIDDNFDGVYSGDCRFYRAGNYSLSLTLDGLHIRGSPYSVSTEPSSLYGPSCVVSFDQSSLHKEERDHSVEDSDEHLSNSDGVPRVIEGGKSETVWMRCYDKYCNLFPSVDSTFVFIECKDEADNVVHHDCVEVIVNSDSLSSFEIVSPMERGSYFWSFGIGGMKESQLIPGPALKSRVVACDICPARCEVQVPDKCVAGNAFPVTVVLRDKRGKKVKIDTECSTSNIDISSTLTPSSEYSICSRAIIQLYQSFGEILAVNIGKLKPHHEFEHLQVLEHMTQVAGEATLEVCIEGIVIYSGKVVIEPDETSPLFVELVGAGASLANWENENEERLLMFQCNDQFGNARGIGGDEVSIEMWRDGRYEDEFHRVSQVCYDQGNGFYDTHVGVINNDIHCLYLLKVTVNGHEVCYSPFAFNNTYQDHNNTTDIQEVEELQKEKVAIRKSKKEKKKLAQIEQANLDKFERLRKQEMTSRRAAEALEREKMKRSKEKEQRRLNRMSKRTGGGFIVQFSKEI